MLGRAWTLVVLGVSACLLGGGGCARPPRPTAAPSTVVAPEHWSTPAVPEHAHAPRDGWWTAFGVAELDTLVDAALRDNPGLEVLVARVDAARAQARQARAAGLPALEGSATASRNRRNLIGFPLPPGVDRRVLSTTYGLSLDTSWELDLWGRIRSSVSAAGAGVQASWADMQGARLSLAGQIAKTYFACLEAHRQVELARAALVAARSTLRAVERRYAKGLRPSLDLRLARRDVAAVERRLRGLELAEALALRQLETLVGRYPRGDSLATASLPELPRELPGMLPGELLRRRPDLVAAERRLAAAGAGVRAARRAFLPRLLLTASAGTSTEEAGDALDGDFLVWNVAGRITQPLFLGGRLQASLDAAHAATRQSTAQYAQAILNAYLEVESTYARETALADQEAAQRNATREALAAESLARERYRRGLVDILTLLEAQRQALDAQSRLLELQRQRLDTRVDLHLALGGGFALDDRHGHRPDAPDPLHAAAAPPPPPAHPFGPREAP